LAFQYVVEVIVGYRSMASDRLYAHWLWHAKHFPEVPFSEKYDFADFQYV
jgi:hypothetical protein